MPSYFFWVLCFQFLCVFLCVFLKLSSTSYIWFAFWQLFGKLTNNLFLGLLLNLHMYSKFNGLSLLLSLAFFWHVFKISPSAIVESYETLTLSNWSICCTKNEVSQYFFTECDQIHRKLWIWSYSMKKYLMGNFLFYAVILFSSDWFTEIFFLCSSLKFWSREKQ